MVEVSQKLLRKYDKPGPRYTSYPTVPVWSTSFGPDDYTGALARLSERPGTGLSLYLHLPFCAKRCHYCGCNSTTADAPRTIDNYLDSVEKELRLLTTRMGGPHRVLQIHWGGGTPNYLNESQLKRAMALLRSSFAIDEQAEISLETDPRLGSTAQVALLREIGFNRISLGVQDFDPVVQKAIGRRQTENRTREFHAACREAGFASVNLDLVYGLPGQTLETFSRTLDIVCDLEPDRIACFSYAHVPWVRPNQKLVDTSRMPTPEEKFALFRHAISVFTGAGYRWIGMDHFARDGDELAEAHRQRRLHRNFMGYSAQPTDDLLALGMSGISELANCFAQNSSDLSAYQDIIDDGQLPIVRGHLLNRDDALRRRIIIHLMCNLELPFDLAAAEFGVDLTEELAEELERLRPLADDGLLVFESDRLYVTDLGRFFIRNICMELDAYLKESAERPVFSRTI